MTAITESFDKAAFLAALRRASAASGVAALLTPAAEEKMAAICERLLAENRRYNLTAIKTPEKAALLHFVDSMTVAHLLPKGARVIDIGAGGGFPSLPLSVVRPDISILAVDATEKKVRYLNDSAALFGLPNLTARAGRAEELAHLPALRESFDVAVARAVAALPVLSELCLPFVKLGGLFLAMKGDGAESELAAAGDAPVILGASPFRVEQLMLKDGNETCQRVACIAEKQRKTPAAYPRLYAKIQKAPLPGGKL